jgi:hypothetical protein
LPLTCSDGCFFFVCHLQVAALAAEFPEGDVAAAGLLTGDKKVFVAALRRTMAGLRAHVSREREAERHRAEHSHEVALTPLRHR